MCSAAACTAAPLRMRREALSYDWRAFFIARPQRASYVCKCTHLCRLDITSIAFWLFVVFYMKVKHVDIYSRLMQFNANADWIAGCLENSHALNDNSLCNGNERFISYWTRNKWKGQACTSWNSMGPTPIPTLGMRLSCNFVNVYTIAHRVLCTVHVLP